MEEKKISSINISREETSEIPAGATHFKFEIDTSGCYYSGDAPEYIIHFYNKENNELH